MPGAASSRRETITHQLAFMCTAVGCAICFLFLRSRDDITASFVPWTTAVGSCLLGAIISVVISRPERGSDSQKKIAWLVIGCLAVSSLATFRALVGASMSLLLLGEILFGGCVGGLLFWGSTLVLRQFAKPWSAVPPSRDPHHEVLPEEQPIIWPGSNLHANTSQTTPSQQPSFQGRNSSEVSNDTYRSYTALMTREPQLEKKQGLCTEKEPTPTVVSVFDTQASSATESSALLNRKPKCATIEENVSLTAAVFIEKPPTIFHPSSSCNMLPSDSTTTNYGSIDRVDRNIQGEQETAVTPSQETKNLEHNTGSSNRPLDLSPALSSKFVSSGVEEDPLTFFRQYLTTDKEQRDQYQYDRRSSTNDRNRRKQRSKPKPTLSPLISPPTSNRRGEEKAVPHAIFRKYMEDHLRRRQSLTNRFLSDDGDELTANSPCNQKQPEPRSVRFADEEGRDMETIFQISSRNLGASTNRRALILLLLPKQHVFEFVGLEYSTDCAALDDKENDQSLGIQIGQILQQLPHLASDPIMAKERFVALLRADTKSAVDAVSELIDSSSIQSYGLSNDAVLLAVPEGCMPKVVVKSSKAVLQNKKLLRSVSVLRSSV